MLGYHHRAWVAAIIGTCLLGLLSLATLQIDELTPVVGAIYKTAGASQQSGNSIKSPYSDTRYDGGGDLKHYKKPGRISAFILAGRQEFVSILDCYLQRNLVRNGGMLDEVLWIIRTQSASDIAYLQGLVDSTPEYISYNPGKQSELSWPKIYSNCRADTIYIKIDDDVVFFEDHTIAAIVKRLVENPQFSVVSANVMNQPALSWVHYHLNTFRPFAPELEPPADYKNPIDTNRVVDWRPSALPAWHGPSVFNTSFDMTNPAPYRHHRWLPLPPNHDIEHTPGGALGEGHHEQYSGASVGFQSWSIAAQEHYSFLTHVENRELWRYKFDLWHYHYDRISINFLAFWGKDVFEHPIQGSDEHYLTIAMPKKLSRPAVLDGTAMAVHFGFHRQVYGHGGTPGRALNDTDLIFRYKGFAEEYICGKHLNEHRL